MTRISIDFMAESYKKKHDLREHLACSGEDIDRWLIIIIFNHLTQGAEGVEEDFLDSL